jgi:hypothetical protein
MLPEMVMKKFRVFFFEFFTVKLLISMFILIILSVEDVNSEMSKVSSENFEIILQFAVFTCIH